MSEMVDRVGKAIAESIVPNCRWDDVARAAIAAMREPTNEMMIADERIEYATKFNHALGWQYSVYEEAQKQGYAVGRVWRAMIDAALKDTL